MNEPYIVYAKPNANGYITSVNSSEFLADTTGWVEIDHGYGDKYHHAMGNYFPKPIQTDGGAYRYKLMGGKAVWCTEKEIKEQEEALKPVPEEALEDRVHTLEADSTEMKEALEMILNGVTE
jgi:hypothetical protein